MRLISRLMLLSLFTLNNVDFVFRIKKAARKHRESFIIHVTQEPDKQKQFYSFFIHNQQQLLTSQKCVTQVEKS